MPVNKSSKDNLIPFEKGKSGNPAGRGRGVQNRSTILKKFLKVKGSFTNPVETTDPENPVIQILTPAEVAALAIIRKAMSGNLAAFQEIQDTLFGKIADKVELEQNHANVVITLPSNGRD